jgi:glycosyltransferase involved in cell wall biosynthesis
VGLAAQIEQLAANRDLRRRLSQAARTTAERRFARATLAREITGVYERLAPTDALRVLHVHSGNLFGGVETLLTTLARDATSVPDMLPSFAVCFEGRFTDELRACGYSPELLGGVRLSRPHMVRRARRKLAGLLATRHVDVVVCHQAWPLAVFGPTIRQARRPLVLWMHTASDGRHWLERWARRTVPSLCVSNSQFTTGCLTSWFPDARIETIYYPRRLSARSDRRSRDAIRRSLRTPEHDVVIVQVGRLESGKGNHEALRAIAKLRDIPNWTFWIVGGPQRASDERYLRELADVTRRDGLTDRVRFVGERRDVAAVLDASDIYCQPNIRPEAFGLSLVEAQAAGLPIVTSAIGGALEIVGAGCGILVAPEDVCAIAAALRRLILDGDLRKRLGRASRDRASERCDLERQMRRLYEAFFAASSRTTLPALGSTAPALGILGRSMTSEDSCP